MPRSSTKSKGGRKRKRTSTTAVLSDTQQKPAKRAKVSVAKKNKKTTKTQSKANKKSSKNVSKSKSKPKPTKKQSSKSKSKTKSKTKPKTKPKTKSKTKSRTKAKSKKKTTKTSSNNTKTKSSTKSKAKSKFASKSVAELKELCRKKYFRVSGSKSDLIARLENPKQEMIEMKRAYHKQLYNKGTRNHIYLPKNHGMTQSQINARIREMQRFDPNDYVWKKGKVTEKR